MNDTGVHVSGVTFALGMLVGGAVGFALWMTTDTFVFFPAFLGVGVALGLAFQAGRDRRRR